MAQDSVDDPSVSLMETAGQQAPCGMAGQLDSKDQEPAHETASHSPQPCRDKAVQRTAADDDDDDDDDGDDSENDRITTQTSELAALSPPLGLATLLNPPASPTAEKRRSLGDFDQPVRKHSLIHGATPEQSPQQQQPQQQQPQPQQLQLCERDREEQADGRKKQQHIRAFRGLRSHTRLYRTLSGPDSSRDGRSSSSPSSSSSPFSSSLLSSSKKSAPTSPTKKRMDRRFFSRPARSDNNPGPADDSSHSPSQSAGGGAAAASAPVASRSHWFGLNLFTSASSRSEKLANDDDGNGKVIDKVQQPSVPSTMAGPLVQEQQRQQQLQLEDPRSCPDDGRLQKDLYDSENNLIESSEDEEDSISSEDDAAHTAGSSPKSRRRGRRKPQDNCSAVRTTADSSSSKAASKSLLTAALEKKQVKEDITAAEPKEQSSSGAEIKPSLSPAGKTDTKKTDVHPRTSFDQSISTTNTPFGSDDEANLSDIHRAQKLSIQMSTVDSSIPNRAIRTIIRGDFAGFQNKADENRRRQRRYLVATDLSEESVYALEWTIGTILRDGDTMFAVCAVHDEGGAGSKEAADHGASAVQIGEGAGGASGSGAKAMQDTAAVIGSQTEETARRSQGGDAAHGMPRTLFSRLGTGAESRSASIDSRNMSRTESERARTVESISQTCVSLLRKTLLQVRIVVEVIHCKSPKNMITEAIDGLEPTLVIVGARGRSAFKGVLLGSFSNYLVTNSSVPVMVARKKLKKQTKQKTTNIRLSNNLTTPKRLALAKVD